jgi:tetracenomycin A2 monooxygenase-dioxygenase
VKPIVDDLLIEIGYRYRSSAVIGGSADAPLIEHPDKLRAAPGTRAPHVVLERDGASISTLDLFGERFVVLTGPNGDAWRAAAGEAAKALGVPIDVWQVGGQRGLRDVDGRFLEAYALEPGGAVLVRPDSFVAWRAASADGRALGRALASILSRGGA